MTYEQRQEVAERFAALLFKEIESMGFTVALNGTEHTHPAFIERLRVSVDQTSLAIRFQPDGVASIGSIPRSLYIEAKNSKYHIEKLAYEQYMKLSGAGNIVAVVFGLQQELDKSKWVFNFVENLVLIDGIATVSRFDPDKRHPVLDGWVYPRKGRRFYDLKTPMASGTPYREIDPQSMLPFAQFKQMVIVKLRESL
jgi:hypothetical protein